MVNEAAVLEVVKTVTSAKAYFFEGTLFVETTDSAIAVKIYNQLAANISAALAFQKVGEETAYDFLA